MCAPVYPVFARIAPTLRKSCFLGAQRAVSCASRFSSRLFLQTGIYICVYQVVLRCSIVPLFRFVLILDVLLLLGYDINGFIMLLLDVLLLLWRIFYCIIWMCIYSSTRTVVFAYVILKVLIIVYLCFLFFVCGACFSR